MAVVGYKPGCFSLDSIRNGDPGLGSDRFGNS